MQQSARLENESLLDTLPAQRRQDEGRMLGVAEYVDMARRHWKLLLLVPLLAAAAAQALALRQAPAYSAGATLLLGSSFGESSLDARELNVLANTYGEMATSGPVLEPVIADLRLDRTASSLAGSVDVDVQNDTQIMQIKAEADTPLGAARLANAVAESLIRWLEESRSKSSSRSLLAIEESLARVRKEMEGVSGDLAALRAEAGPVTAERRSRIASLEALQTQYQNTYNGLLGLDVEQRFQLSQTENRLRLVDPAEPPGGATGSSPYTNTLLAGALGLAAAGMIVVALERTNDRIRLPEDVHREVGLPVLAGIPRSLHSSRLDAVSDPHSPASEAIRALRARLQFATGERGIGALVVTSPRPSEGKSMIAANLAMALAQGGQEVVLVDADVRSPRQHALFGTPLSPGFSNLLLQSDWELEGALAFGQHPRLRVLSAGTRPANPSELLTRERLGRVLTELKAVADVVVIDAPGLLSLTDTMLLSASADNAVVVVEAGRTMPQVLSAAVASVTPTGVNVLGVVLADVDEGSSAS